MKLTIITLMVIAIAPAILYGNSNGPPSGYANNAPSYNNCTTCHSGSANSGDGEIFFTGLPDSYAAGVSYTIGITVTGANSRGFGYQAAAQIGDVPAGVFSLIPNSSGSELNGDFIQQNTRLENGSWTFEWTAPANTTENIVFSASGLATGGSTGTSGDEVYTTQIEVPAQSVSVSNNIKISALNIQSSFPNPFNSRVKIRFYLPINQNVVVKIYNLNGQNIKNLFSGDLVDGNHNIVWDATNDQGQEVPYGVYYYTIESDGLKQVRTITYLK